LDYRLLKESYFIITIAGPTVANKKERNSNDCETNVGNNSTGSIIPTSKLLEKSGAGNKRNPPIKPKIIEIYAVFSFSCLL
tara:strand:+ start:634 stop:876 length:243 start_codon:yes stop_codon:yes gene_type:complete